jgi:prefoldin subunit 5
MSKRCQNDVKKLSKSCQKLSKVVKKLSKSCQTVVKKLSQKVVTIGPSKPDWFPRLLLGVG